MSPIFTSDMEDISLVTEEAEKELKREKFLEFIVGVNAVMALGFVKYKFVPSGKLVVEVIILPPLPTGIAL